MEPIQIIRLIFIILKVVAGIIGIIYFCILSKKDDSKENEQATSKETSQLKTFAIVVIAYMIISFIEIILRFISDII